MNLEKAFSNLKTYLYKNYGENPGKMLLHTGTAGWILSSAAQIMAIVTNDKIAPEQKTFLIPQELGDGLINIFSFYCLTSSVKNVCSKMVSNGKIANKAIKNYLEKNKLTTQIGKMDFDIKKSANYAEIKDEFMSFKNGVDILASTTGSILSCNIVTPLLRNEYAAAQQKVANEELRKRKENLSPATQPYNRFTMDKFQSSLANGTMRV